MIHSLNIQFEKAVRLLVRYTPVSDESSRKPIIPHDIRVGVYLYERGYSPNIVLSGILHDALEFTSTTKEIIEKEFGGYVLQLVMANTKNDTIADPEEKTDELIQRCARNGQDALIIKAADILDSFKFYTSVDNKDQLAYCQRNAQAIFRYKPAWFDDKIFDELKMWLL